MYDKIHYKKKKKKWNSETEKKKKTGFGHLKSNCCQLQSGRQSKCLLTEIEGSKQFSLCLKLTYRAEIEGSQVRLKKSPLHSLKHYK